MEFGVYELMWLVLLPKGLGVTGICDGNCFDASMEGVLNRSTVVFI